MDDLQLKIKKTYANFISPSKKPTFKELCFPDKFNLQVQQRFVEAFIHPRTDNKRCLVFHRIGAGKTCVAIRLAISWYKYKRVFIVVPASLVSNVYKEFRSGCAGTKYITESERKILSKVPIGSPEYNRIIETSNARIDKDCTILSFNKYITLYNSKQLKLKSSVLIIDEVQNIVSETGSTYRTFLKSINESSSDARIILMSATPIFDKPVELALTLNLLKPETKLPIGTEFNDMFLKEVRGQLAIKNSVKLRKMIQGLISYYPGAPAHAFPEKIFKVVKCTMSKFQYESYKVIMNREGKGSFENILDMSNDFFIGSRMMSNVAFPNVHGGALGFRSWTKKATTLEKLENYSIKIYKFIKKLKKTRSPTILYTNFRTFGGIDSIVVALETNGYKNVLKHGPGKKRFGIWSGVEKMKDKELVRDLYNQQSNADGSKLLLMLLSPAGKEGLSLFRTRTIHLFEPYWNSSRIEQIIGRGIRFCSHKDLPSAERNVKVYMYLAISSSKKIVTVDQYIYQLMISKETLVKQFYEVMKNAAVDRYLFENAVKHALT